MKTIITTIASLLLGSSLTWAQNAQPQHIWIEFADRTIMADSVSIAGVDSISFTENTLYTYKNGKIDILKSYSPEAIYHFGESFNRAVVIPNQYSSVDFSRESSKFCFARSKESEHFICFWENGLTADASGNISLGGSTTNVNNLLREAEQIWKVYVEQLGFLKPGASTTDRAKILMFIVNQTDWRADGSGEAGICYYMAGSTKRSRTYKVGLFHCNPQAAIARGGHTVAHEIGHTFQYLTGADCGGTHGLNYVLGTNSKGNEWWEDCANWQAYKVYPQYQYSDGEYYEQYLNLHHLNIHHEAARYANCFYHDWWCQLHGLNTIGRIWREATSPNDPTQTYMKLFGLDEQSFADEQFAGYMRLASIDIDAVREYGKAKIGAEPNRLVEPSATITETYLGGDNRWWMVSPDYCVQNYGYNANPLKVPAAGTTVKVSFKGIAGAPSFRSVNTAYAGWRYGLAAYCNDGSRHYSDIGRNPEGEVSLTIPEGCQNLWLVVMGAPTKYWTHAWDDDTTNDEQWPYAVRIDGTSPLGAMRHYGEFPASYARHDTTIVVDAKLAYSASQYSSVMVQYDMNAISEALGLSTEQLKSLKRNDTSSNTGDIRFAGVSGSAGVVNFNTTTSTSSSTVYGHWFTTAGKVCNYDNSAAIFAELTPADYRCKVGQYPGRLTAGQTYTIRQAIIYTHTNGKMYRATIEVRLSIL